jgi:hypothetical protein
VVKIKELSPIHGGDLLRTSKVAMRQIIFPPEALAGCWEQHLKECGSDEELGNSDFEVASDSDSD